MMMMTMLQCPGMASRKLRIEGEERVPFFAWNAKKKKKNAPKGSEPCEKTPVFSNSSFSERNDRTVCAAVWDVTARAKTLSSIHTIAAEDSARPVGTSLTGRDISVAVINLVGFHAYAATTPAARIVRDHEAVVAYVHEAARRCGGVLDTFAGDKFWVSFNATSRCDEHASRRRCLPARWRGRSTRRRRPWPLGNASPMLSMEAMLQRRRTQYLRQRGAMPAPSQRLLLGGAVAGGATAGVATGKAFVGTGNCAHPATLRCREPRPEGGRVGAFSRPLPRLRCDGWG